MSDVVSSKPKLKNKLKFSVGKSGAKSSGEKVGEIKGNDQRRSTGFKGSEFDSKKREKRRSSSLSKKKFGSNEGVVGKVRLGTVDSGRKWRGSLDSRDVEGRRCNAAEFGGEEGGKRVHKRVRVGYGGKAQDEGKFRKKFLSLEGRKSRNDDFIKGDERRACALRGLRFSKGSGALRERKPTSEVNDKRKAEDVLEKKVRVRTKVVAKTKKQAMSGEDELSDERVNGQVDKCAKGKVGLKKVADGKSSWVDSSKKKASSKKKLDDSSEGAKDAPKKKKKIIRIDPHDISNKRLDDGVSLKEEAVEKKVEKSTELSMNAQFRAIQPSPAILSFVEENLLGRRRSIEWRRAGYNIDLSAPLDNIPGSTSTEREKIEDNVFRNKLTFFAAAKVSSSFPPSEIPEIAFAGRSNVGKSSLLNALTRQWGVVRTSDKPGLTQTINFFQLASKLCLVDLPGYGFAYAKDEVKDAWEELVKEYVSTRAGLKRVCLLIDTKWGMKARDYELIDLMERSETKYQIVLTKTDVVFPIDVARHAMQIEERLKTNKSVVNPVMMVSSKTGAGIRCLRSVLAKIVRFAK